MVGVNNVPETTSNPNSALKAKLGSDSNSTAAPKESISQAATSSSRSNASGSSISVGAAPSGCATRGRKEDSALAAAALAAHLRGMDAGVLESLVRARESAAGIVRSFPGGDERFASVDACDSESGEEIDADAVGDEDADEPCTGLFDDKTDSSPMACLQRARDDTGLDLLGEMRRHKVPFHVRIRAVNSIRASVSAGLVTADLVVRVRSELADRTSPIWMDDALLKPVIPGDILLTGLGDDDSDSDGDCDGDGAVAEAVHSVIN